MTRAYKAESILKTVLIKIGANQKNETSYKHGA